MALSASFKQLIDDVPVRAGAFIVTLYGDVVAPRGGQLWMGNIVETCAAANISESRVRTAVSRLVGSEQLEGERDGRRSFYQLTRKATHVFERAASQIYRTHDASPMLGWHLVVLPQGPAREVVSARLAARGFGFPNTGLAILPNRGSPPPNVDAIRFVADTHDDLTALAQRAWPLDDLNAKASFFVEKFSPFLNQPVPPTEALVLRLMLVHVFREIALSDPDLPVELLPAGWQGQVARDVFAKLYISLSNSADAAIADRFVDARGPLRGNPVLLARRIVDLSGG
jgi:phenylacetic acid degradation operon negative regulatory protein